MSRERGKRCNLRHNPLYDVLSELSSERLTNRLCNRGSWQVGLNEVAPVTVP